MMGVRTKREPTAPPPGVKLYRVEEAAYLLRCSIATVYREIRDGNLARREERGKLFIHADDLDTYLQSIRRQERRADDSAPPTPRQIDLRKMGLWDGDDT